MSMTTDTPHPVLRRLATEVKSGDCSIEQALTAAFQLGYVQRDIDASDVKALQGLMLDEGSERVYRCPECCDTGCVLDESLVPTAVTEGDMLVSCPHCAKREQSVIAIRQILPSALNAEAIEFLRDNAVEILGEPKR